MILQNVHSRLQAEIWRETLFNYFLTLYFFCYKCPMKSDFTKALTLILIHNQYLASFNLSSSFDPLHYYYYCSINLIKKSIVIKA